MNALLQRLPVVWKIMVLLSPFVILPFFLYLIVQGGKNPGIIPSKASDILFFGLAPLTAFGIFYITILSFYQRNNRKITSHLTTFFISVILVSVCIYTSIIALIVLSPAAASL